METGLSRSLVSFQEVLHEDKSNIRIKLGLFIEIPLHGEQKLAGGKGQK